MEKLIIIINASDGTNLDVLMSKAVASLIILDGIDSMTVLHGSDYEVRKTIPVFTGESLARAVKKRQTGVDNA